MKAKPVVMQCELQVKIAREDFEEFKTLVISKNPPEWLPASYRITKTEQTNFVPETEPIMIVRVLLQYVGQTKVK